MNTMRTNAIRIAAIALLSPLLQAQTVSIDDLLAQAAKWQYETSRQSLQAISEAVAKAQRSPAETRAMEQKFIAFLKSDATPGGKDFICKQLSVMGSEASVPVLSAMLADPKTAELGRYALERIPGEGVDRALREALPKSGERARIGIINTLGIRRDRNSVPALRPLALGSQPALASAALFALARIADPTALPPGRCFGRIDPLAARDRTEQATACPGTLHPAPPRFRTLVARPCADTVAGEPQEVQWRRASRQSGAPSGQRARWD